MRKVILHMESREDFTHRLVDDPEDVFTWKLNNRKGDAVYFMTPQLRRKIIEGVVFEDRCVGFDRLFTADRNILLTDVKDYRGLWF